MQESLFTVAKLDDFVPSDHPLRAIQTLVNEALGCLNGLFNSIHAGTGRKSIAPEKLMRALLLQVFYSVRSERQLMARARQSEGRGRIRRLLHRCRDGHRRPPRRARTMTMRKATTRTGSPPAGRPKRARLAAAAACALFAGLPGPLHAACTAASGPATAALVELYTSEGCSSCPPADKWLSALVDPRVVPLALHVDYWDYLGWRDRFADARFSTRQREVVGRGGGRVVYTPQVLLDGRDFRAWRDGAAFAHALAATAAKPARARLALAAERTSAGWSIRLDGQVAARKGRAHAYLAVYENGLASEVRAGENAGARLRHGHVVREWAGPIAAGADGRIAFSRMLSRPEIDFTRAGIAAFVEDPDSGEILQALALPFCPD